MMALKQVKRNRKDSVGASSECMRLADFSSQPCCRAERNLQQACGSFDIPYIVAACTQAVDDRFLDTKGIYRLSGCVTV